MATIYKLPSGSWRAQVRLTGQKPIGKTFSKKGDARTWGRLMEGDKDAAADFPDAEARRRTVEQAIDGYVLDRPNRDRSIVYRLAWWKDRYGATPLTDFGEAKIRDGLRQLASEEVKRGDGRGATRGKSKTLGRKKGNATINRYHQAISSVLSWAKQESWIAKNPALGIKRKQEPRGRVRYLSDNERKALLEACDQSEWTDLGLLVRLALSTGARQSELLNLRWEDLDLKSGVATLGNTKNDERRVLPLVESVRAQLEAKTRPIKGGLLFPSPKDADKPFAFLKHWHAAVKAAELKNFRFHDLRHSCASYLAMSGASPLEIGDVLGHKTLAMVRRYSHLSTEHKKRLTERVLGNMVE